MRAQVRLAALLFVFAILTPLAPRNAFGAHRLNIYAPANGSVVLGRTLTVDVRGSGCHGPKLKAEIDGKLTPLDWSQGPYPRQWIARLVLEHEGTHRIRFFGACRGLTSFSSQRRGAADVGRKLAEHFVATHPAKKLGWDWGPAVFLYGLARLQPTSAYVQDYYSHWAGKGIPTPNKSDACAGALGALALSRAASAVAVEPILQKVAHYLLTEPRNNVGSLNHLGHSFLGHFYPDSIWVDSLVMIGVFATQYGHETGNDALFNFGASQPEIFAAKLQDTDSGLFRHAWLIKKEMAYPPSPTFWLRGNGWVLMAIAEILDELPADSPRRAPLVEIFRRVIAGLKVYQQPTGLWDSVANLPGYSYGETSGTSLIAYAVAHGVHRGWLDQTEMAMAKRAFTSVTSRLKGASPGLSMPRISGATNPLPRIFYRLTPAGTDRPYGVGAYLLAAAEMKDEEFE